ncbi:MAG: DPP IV N-terminal domain-containing protein [Gemmatimonadaceae bacterium]
MRAFLSRSPCANVVGFSLALAFSFADGTSARAQATSADFQRAEGLRQQLDGLIVDAPESPNWIEEGRRFWYRKSVRGGNAFVMFDIVTKAKSAPFDHARLAAALPPKAGTTYSAVTLPFRDFTLADQGKSIDVVIDSTRVHCDIVDYRCTRLGAMMDTVERDPRRFGGGLYGAATPVKDRPRLSPDGAREVTVRNFNLFVRGVGAKDWSALSSDGSEGDAYALTSIAWSPDSKRVAAFRIRPGYKREVHYVESSPDDQLQPKYSSRLYNKPGDVLDKESPVIFDVDSKSMVAVDDALFPNAYEVSPLHWHRDSKSLTFDYNQRGHQVYRVIEVDAANGRTRAVIDEKSPTFFEYSGKKFRFDLNDGKEIVWMSERDGWNHLYLYDGATGAVKNQITKGNWLVRSVERVDTVARQVIFAASGMYPGKDPYFVHYYRINLDGTGLTALTDADATHSVSFSPDYTYYVDSWSRVDLPPIAQLHRTADRSLVSEVEHADASALVATGWRPPEVFTSLGRDGKSEIWGVIIRPTHFDAKRAYPVIENIYAGPHGSFVPKTFSNQVGMQALAELGFIVVQIDGMGTSNRSKYFHDVAWKNLKDAGFPDRILWHKAVAAKYKWYDISRVGIYGTSAGGQSAMGALLFHPEFYKAAASSAGCHDNRMDKIWWNEQWMGWPIGPEYGASSNVDNAWRLQGKLLLLVGEMDRNVDPSSTFQVVNALIKANKNFDLLVIPGADHTSGGVYGDRKRYDFFVHQLQGVEPPNRNTVVAPAAVGSR